VPGNHFREYEEGNGTSEIGRLVFEGIGTTHVTKSRKRYYEIRRAPMIVYKHWCLFYFEKSCGAKI